MQHLSVEEIRQIVREQSRIVQTDQDQAIASLTRLLPQNADREAALGMIAVAVSRLGRELNLQERAILERIERALVATAV